MPRHIVHAMQKQRIANSGGQRLLPSAKSAVAGQLHGQSLKSALEKLHWCYHGNDLNFRGAANLCKALSLSEALSTTENHGTFGTCQHGFATPTNGSRSVCHQKKPGNAQPLTTAFGIMRNPAISFLLQHISLPVAIIWEASHHFGPAKAESTRHHHSAAEGAGPRQRLLSHLNPWSPAKGREAWNLPKPKLPTLSTARQAPSVFWK